MLLSLATQWLSGFLKYEERTAVEMRLLVASLGLEADIRIATAAEKQRSKKKQ